MSLTVEQFRDLKNKTDKANEDNTPYPVVDGANISVFGDANLTKVKKNDYTIVFGFPKDKKMCEKYGLPYYDTKPPEAEETPLYYEFTVNYDGVAITPRSNLGIVGATMDFLKFFRELKEDGGVEKLEKVDVAMRFMRAGKDVQLAMYNLAATFLDIDDKYATWMEPLSVCATVGKVLDEHPEIVNEAERFLLSSTGEPATTAQQ